MWRMLAAALVATVVATACEPSRFATAASASSTYHNGPQQVTLYTPAQAHAAERSLGYRVVEPVGVVRGAARLRLATVIVTELLGRKIIHYVFGDLHHRWVLVTEAPDAVIAFHYDAAGAEVTFASHGRGISVTTDLPPPVFDRIVHRLGGPAHAVPGG